MSRALIPVIDRVMARVDTSGECWQWQGALRNGYGVVGIGNKRLGYVHRIVYEHLIAAIPEGLHIDHLCRNRPCCNPAHLEPVTQAENNLRSWQARGEPTHCKRDHEMSPENTRLTAHQRHCRACERLSLQRAKARKRAAA
jgi:hypothetical protein